MCGEHRWYPRRADAIVAWAAAVVMCGCGFAAGHGDSARFAAATPLSAPTGVGTAPMFAVAPNGKEAAAWVSAPEGGTDGRLYISVDGGAPAEIRDSLGPIEAHGEAPPKLAYGPNGTLYAVYTVGKVVPGLRFPLSALRLVSSRDGGAHWTAPVTVTTGAVFGSHSFHALHAASDGTIYVSWLGAPDKDAASDTGMSHMPHDMPMAESAVSTGHSHEASASWIARSTDGGLTWSPPTRVDPGEACPCCRTALGTGRDGTVYMAWRHVFPGNIRDIVVARSNDHGATWTEPVRVHADDWRFDACPHAGPALAVDSSGSVHVAWWTGKEGGAGVYYARSTDGAKTFESPVALGVAQYSRPAHVQLALAMGQRVIVAWDDGTVQVPQVLVRVSSDGGRDFGEAIPLSESGRSATFPVLGVSGDSLAVAWSEESSAAAAAESRAAPDMNDPRATAALHAVGEAQVLVRRGALQ